MRSALVLKWCCCAPRDRPARLATSGVVVALAPTSARLSTAASSRRVRVVELRSSCDRRHSGRRAIWFPSAARLDIPSGLNVSGARYRPYDRAMIDRWISLVPP
jgi:hypothetical protein